MKNYNVTCPFYMKKLDLVQPLNVHSIVRFLVTHLIASSNAVPDWIWNNGLGHDCGKAGVARCV